MTYCYRHLTAEDRAAIMMMRATHSIRALSNVKVRARGHAVAGQQVAGSIASANLLQLDPLTMVWLVLAALPLAVMPVSRRRFA